MCQWVRSRLQNNAAVAATAVAVLLILTPAVCAQQADAMRPDDGAFPLTPGQVAELQGILQSFHYDPGATDGTVVSKTVSAAKALAGLLEREMLRRPSGQEIVLACEIEEGASKGSESIQIMVDEQRGIAVYNFQLDAAKNFNPIRKIGEGYIDLSMKITLHNEGVIQANNTSGALVISKKDGKFVHSFVTPFPLGDGTWLAFGNTHAGKCARSAFE